MKKASYIILGLILSFKINSQIQLISISNPTNNNSEDGAIDILLTPTSSLYKYYWNIEDPIKMSELFEELVDISTSRE